MGTEYFELTSNGPPRVAVEWENNYQSTRVYMDRRHIGTFPDRRTFQQGQVMPLPEGNQLAVRLQRKGVGTYEVQAALDGRKLKVAVGERRRREAFQALMVVAVLTLLSGLARSGLANRVDIESGIYLGAAIIFFILGYMVRNRSQGALGVAILLYGLDTLIIIVSLFSRNVPPNALFAVFLHIVILVPLIRAYNNLGEDYWFALTESKTSSPPVPIRQASQPLRIDLQLDSPTSAPVAKPLTPRSPEDAAAIEKLTLALRLYRVGSNEAEARKLVKSVLQERPKWADAWYVVAYMMDKPDERQKALERVLSLDPNHASGLKLQIQRKMGQTFIDELLVAPPTTEQPLSMSQLQERAADAIKAGKTQDARSLLRNALAIDPNNADTWFVASFLTTDVGVRREVLRRALQGNPNHQMAQETFAKLNTRAQLFPELESVSWEPRL